MPTPAEITTHHDPDPDENPYVAGRPEPYVVTLVEYNPDWPSRFAAVATDVRSALGDRALHLEHVGSTSVPGLAAKDVIDVDLTVADPREEDAYVPALTAIGYRHTIREPSWHEHRLLELNDPRVNLHVFGPDCPETIRHIMFRDWLTRHPDDRARYERAKRDAVPGGGAMMDYNLRKQDVIREIYDRAFRAAGLL